MDKLNFKIKTLLDIKNKPEQGHQSGPLLKLDEPEWIFFFRGRHTRKQNPKLNISLVVFVVFHLPQIFMKYGFCRCFCRHGKSIHHNTSVKLQKSEDLKTQSVLQFAFFNCSDKRMVNQIPLESTVLTFVKLS